MLKKIQNKILALLLLIIVLNPGLAMAQPQQPQTGNELPKYSGVEQSIEQYLCTPSATAAGQDLANCINKMYRFAIAFGAIAVVFFLVVAGYTYITGGESGKEKGKAILRNALIGLAMLLGTYLLLGFVNPQLTIFKPINPPVFNDPGLPDSCEELGYDPNCGIVEEGAPEGGSSAPPTHFPGPSGSAQQLAQQILNRNDINILCLGTASSCARKNLQDTAAGNAATRSCPSQGITGTVNISATLLSGILGMADTLNFTFNINHILGGCHSGPSSYHYAGRAVDLQTGSIDQVNQMHNYCSTAGEHFGPTHNPHPRHAHCAW